MNNQPQEMTDAERDAAVAEYVRKINAFADGTSRVCPECGEPVLGAMCYEKTEPTVFSLYVQPCNHRLGLWSEVPAWITDIECVSLDAECDNCGDDEDWDEEEDVDDGSWDFYGTATDIVEGEEYGVYIGKDNDTMGYETEPDEAGLDDDAE